jgi:hypothetical protein
MAEEDRRAAWRADSPKLAYPFALDFGAMRRCSGGCPTRSNLFAVAAGVPPAEETALERLGTAATTPRRCGRIYFLISPQLAISLP